MRALYGLKNFLTERPDDSDVSNCKKYRILEITARLLKNSLGSYRGKGIFFDLNSLLGQLQNAFEMRHIEDEVSEEMVKGYVKSVLRRIEVVQPVSGKEKAYYSIGITYCPHGVGTNSHEPKVTRAISRNP